MIRHLFTSRGLALFLLLVLLVVGFSVFVDGFLDWPALCKQSRYWVATGIVAVPMTFIIATAGIDLSVGSIVALAGVTLGLLYVDAGWSIWLAGFAAVATGAAAGALNGGISSYLRVPPLVVTLATMALFRGLAMGLSRARSLGGFSEGFRWLAGGNVLAFLPGGGEQTYLPFSLVIMLLIFAVGGVLMRKSWIGRFAECIGANETAAAFAAIDVRNLKALLYTASGTACGVAALFHTSLYATAKADTAVGLELEAIAAVVVGGTRISGGRGSVLGTLLGLLIIGVLRHGLLMAGVRQQYVVIYVGILVVVAAVLNERIASRKGGVE
ncbi:MAG: ABC transporter permease [Candidatus Hydrogenedentes bacterium]|nr:ABC transporter permease [Candidatus Hydrogenedentota bacterium]